ncbi:MAG: nitroreductase family protein [Candidatus Saganbacteria bacterium]|nr:nitroreductase family protein [Candidatus Saganbacteria bacterium]
MDVKEAIEKRRAYRSLDKAEITKELVDDLSHSASLAASCFNNQPWRFIFVYEEEQLKKLKTALNKGNEWAGDASMIIAVASKKDTDCVVKGREYFLFDTGMATAHLILRATELGLVAHPIAGYDEQKAREILNVPEDMTVITLINVGKHSGTIRPTLSEKQAEGEKDRPKRLPPEKFSFINKYE